MKPQIVKELNNLRAAIKHGPEDVLIASVESGSLVSIVTDPQRDELPTRLAHHRAHASEPDVTFQRLQAKFLASAA